MVPKMYGTHQERICIHNQNASTASAETANHKLARL